MSLETSRLLMRPWDVNDAEELYEYAKDPTVWPNCWWKPHTSVENSRDIIRDYLIVPENYAIVNKENSWIVWSIWLVIWKESKLCADDKEAEVWFWIWVPHQWKWYVTEATKELLRHAFDDLWLDKVWCGYYEWNDKSKRVQEKCWFSYRYNIDHITNSLGQIKNEIVQCLSLDDWRKFNK